LKWPSDGHAEKGLPEFFSVCFDGSDFGTDHHRQAGEADIVLERDAATGKLAARLALDRGLPYQAPCGFSSADG
jgi:hypothetical protein